MQAARVTQGGFAKEVRRRRRADSPVGKTGRCGLNHRLRSQALKLLFKAHNHGEPHHSRNLAIFPTNAKRTALESHSRILLLVVHSRTRILALRCPEGIMLLLPEVRCLAELVELPFDLRLLRLKLHHASFGRLQFCVHGGCVTLLQDR